MIGGLLLQAWQFVPVVYMVLAVVFMLVTRWAFVKYQVSGR